MTEDVAMLRMTIEELGGEEMPAIGELDEATWEAVAGGQTVALLRRQRRRDGPGHRGRGGRLMTSVDPVRVAASRPTSRPPSGGDWIPVATDGLWWWDGRGWESTVRSPWPAAQPIAVTAATSRARTHRTRRLLGLLLGLPFRMGWFLLRPVLGMAIGLLSVVAVLAVAAVLIAHAVH